MSEKTEGSNQEWTIQRNLQHWVHKTQDEDKAKNTTQKTRTPQKNNNKKQKQTTTTTTTTTTGGDPKATAMDK